MINDSLGDARPTLTMFWQRLRPQLPCPHARCRSTALHFYQNRQLDVYAAKEAHRLTLRQLVHYFLFVNRLALIHVVSGLLRTPNGRGTTNQGMVRVCRDILTR